MAIGKKIADFGTKAVAVTREGTLSARVAAMESELDMLRNELKKIRRTGESAVTRKKKDDKQKNVRSKTRKSKKAGRPRNSSVAKTSVRTIVTGKP